jgi:hypothetical protein
VPCFASKTGDALVCARRFEALVKADGEGGGEEQKFLTIQTGERSPVVAPQRPCAALKTLCGLPELTATSRGGVDGLLQVINARSASRSG